MARVSKQDRLIVALGVAPIRPAVVAGHTESGEGGVGFAVRVGQTPPTFPEGVPLCLNAIPPSAACTISVWQPGSEAR